MGIKIVNAPPNTGRSDRRMVFYDEVSDFTPKQFDLLLKRTRKMNDLEQKIFQKESEVHHLVTKHRDKTQTPTPYTKVGYKLEDAMLADFMTWARNTYPQLRKCLFHIENEGSASGKDAARLGGISLAKGKLAGVFDIQSVYKGKMIWIELKLPGETLSPKQQELYDLWISWGVEIHIVKTFAEFKFVIEEKILRF